MFAAEIAGHANRPTRKRWSAVTSGFDSGSFDDFIARFFGGQGRPGDPRRPVYRVDLSRLLTAPARAMVAAAAQHVADRGGHDLGAEHLLWSATQLPGLADLLAVAGADPDDMASEVDSLTTEEPPTDQAPELTPAAKRALLEAHQISRALGAGYIGPARAQRERRVAGRATSALQTDHSRGTAARSGR
jgi:ATP-dependent Clp protease ATP-binding subunit ClpC